VNGVVVFGKMLDHHLDLQEPNLWVPARLFMLSPLGASTKSQYVRVRQQMSRAPG
jgi:hypothetical protein